MEVGVNFPPFHSWCRTTFIGVLDGLLESGKSDIIDSNKDDKTHLKKQFSYTHKGKRLFIPAGALFEVVKIIAGKGSETPLRIKAELAELYGGKQDDWMKKVGKIESDMYIFDMHWYELDGNTEQYEIKMKYRGEKK